MADWNDWGEDDQLDFGAPLNTSHTSSQQQQLPSKVPPKATSVSTLTSGWDDEESPLFDAPTKASKSHVQAPPTRVNTTTTGPRTTIVQQRAPQTQRVLPTASDELFVDVTPPSVTPQMTATPSSISSIPTASHSSFIPSNGTHGSFNDGWDDDFDPPPPKLASTTPKRLDVDASLSPSSQSFSIQPNGPHLPAQRAQTNGHAPLPQKVLPAPNTASTTSISTSHLPQNGIAVAATPKTVPGPTQTPTQPQRPVQSTPAKTPLRPTPAPSSHAKTPSTVTQFVVSTDPKTPVSASRTFKPTSSIKLPSMPTRTPQSIKTPAATATPANATQSSISSNPAVSSSTTPTLTSTVTLPTQTALAPVAASVTSTVPPQSQPITKSASSRRLTEDGKPIPLTRTQRPIIPDSPVSTNAPPAAVAENQYPLPTQQPPTPAKVSAPATQKKPVGIVVNPTPPIPVTTGVSSSLGSFNDWEDDLLDLPPTALTQKPSQLESNYVETISSVSTAESSTIPSTDIQVQHTVNTTSTSITTATTTQTSSTETSDDWNDDWGSDTDLALPASSAPSFTPSAAPTADITSPAQNTEPITSAVPQASDDFGWSDEDGLTIPTPVTPTSTTTTLEQNLTATSMLATDLASKPALTLDSIKPKPMLPQPAPTAISASNTSPVKEPPKPSVVKQSIAFVPPTLTYAEPPKSSAHSAPSAHGHLASGEHHRPPKSTASLPPPRVMPPSIATFTPSTPVHSDLVLPHTTPGSATAPPNSGVPPPRSARPKPLAPKVQPQIAAPFSASSQSHTTSHAPARTSMTGPMPLEEMKRPRAVATFGFGGSLVMVFPRATFSSSSSAQAGAVSIVSTSKLLATHHETVAMRSFPGPAITKSSKELLNFLTARCKHADQSSLHSNPVRGEASRLLWHLMRLLVSTKGVVNGSKGCEKEMLELLNAPPPNPDVLVGLPQILAADCSEDPPVPIEKRKELTLKIQALVHQGKREDALALATSERLWDHALLLAAWISPSVHRDTVSAFVIATMPVGSPLRTTYLQLAGKYQDFFKLSPNASLLNPAASLAPFNPHGGPLGHLTPGIGPRTASGTINTSSTSSNPYQGLIDNWKANLTSLMANKPVVPQIAQGANAKAGTTGPDQALIHLGDALWTHSSSVEAAHICYLLADYKMDGQMDPGSRLALVGGDHKRHPRSVFSNVEALHMSELLEYSKRQSVSGFQFTGLQPYKLVYASTLIDIGLLKPALDYLESIKLLVGENKASQSAYSPTFLSKLAELHMRVKAMVDGKPISTIIAASTASTGAASQKSSWLGSIVTAAFDKIMGDDDEVPKQGETSSPAGALPPNSGLNQSGNLLVSVPSAGPGTLTGKPFTPMTGQGPMSSSGGIAPPHMLGPNMPNGGPQIGNTTPAMNVPPANIGFVNNGPIAGSLKKIPLPKIGAQVPAHPPSAPNPVTTQLLPSIPAAAKTGVPTISQPTGFGPTGASPVVPLSSTGPTPANGLNALPPFPLPTVRATNPKVPAKPSASVSNVPAPTAQNTSPSAAKSTLSDDEEAELFESWDMPVKESEETPKVEVENSKIIPTKTAQELADEAELFDGEFELAGQSSNKETNLESTVAIESEAEESTRAPPLPTNEENKHQELVTATPSPIGATLPPPKRVTVPAPGSKKTRTSLVAFRPSGGASTPPVSSPATPTPATPPVPQPSAETGSSAEEASSNGISSPTTLAEPAKADTAAPPPPKAKKKREADIAPTETEAQNIKEAPTQTQSETSERTPTPPVPTIDSTETKSTPTTPSTPSSDPPAPAPTPKRPSLLPPKKTPASKPAFLSAPEGLPPLDEITKKPFKPLNAPSAVPPSSSQQKRAERMNRSISASAMSRPDNVALPTKDLADDEAHSDDERAQEKVLEDARAQIEAEDKENPAPVVAPVSALPPIAKTGPPSKNPSHLEKEPKDKPSRRPVPKPLDGPSPPGFVPTSQPSSLVTPVFTPTKEPAQDYDAPTEETPVPDVTSSFKTPQARKSKSSSSTASTAGDAPNTEPKKTRFGWLNPRNWFPSKKQVPNEPTPTKAKLGGTLKDGPFYRHPELGWVERGKEEEKRKELAAAAAPPSKSTKKKPKPTETETDPGLVTPQPARGPFNRTSQLSSEAEQTTPGPAPTPTAPGSSRSGRGRRYVGHSGDVIETSSKSAPPPSLLAMAPMTPLGTGKVSVFTPSAPPPSEESDPAPTGPTEPIEPVAIVRQPKKPKPTKASKKKNTEAGEGGDNDSDDASDVINAQPLTLTASFPISQDDDDEDDGSKPPPRKTLAERKAEAAAAAANSTAPSSVAGPTSPPTSGGRPKFGSPSFSGFKPSSASSGASSSTDTQAFQLPPAEASATEAKAKKTKKTKETSPPAEEPETPTAEAPSEDIPEATEEPAIAAPAPVVPSGLAPFAALPTIGGLPPPGGARSKAGVKAARPKSAAARFQPMSSTSPSQQ